MIAGLAAVLAAVETVRTRSRWVVPFLFVVIAGNGILTTTIKDVADRVRPALNPIAETLGPSFPSGHSSWSAAFFAAAALLLSRGRSTAARAAIAGGRGRACRHGGRQPGAPRCALAERRDRRPGARLGVVLDLRHRLRRTADAIRRRSGPRCPGGGGAAGRRPRADPARRNVEFVPSRGALRPPADQSAAPSPPPPARPR